MPIRNPFAKRPDPASADDNERPVSRSKSENSDRRQERAEYKLSDVNEGVYLPPSPPEKRPFWPKRKTPSISSAGSSVREIEPFPISQELFESYRRSFDIPPRFPVIPKTSNPCGRHSLDVPRLQRSAMHEPKFERQPPTAEEFEDVNLNDPDVKKELPGRKGFFGKFGDGETPPQTPTSLTSTGMGMGRFHLPGRKRGHSGQGAELGDMKRPGTVTPVASTVSSEA